MRAHFFWFLLTLAMLAGPSLAMAANYGEAPIMDKPLIRRISAEESIADPVQPQSVVSPDYYAPTSAYDGSVTATATATENIGGGSLYDDFCHCCECCDIGGWQDNSEVWIGLDTFRSRGDGIVFLGPISPPLGNSTGAVAGFNTAFALGDSPIRGQIGGSYGIYDWKGRYLPFSDASPEQQTFITFGVSKRSNIECGDPISWGLVFDQMFDHQWGFLADEIYLSQFRFVGGYALNECNEVGIMGTIHSQSDEAQGFAGLFAVPAVRIRTMNQASLFLRQNWEFGGTTMAYVGLLDSADVGDWMFGIQGSAPLSHNVSLYGNFTYVAPTSGSGLFGSSLEQWNLSFGLVYSFGGKSVSPTVSGPQGMPLMPVANNGNFLVTD